MNLNTEMNQQWKLYIVFLDYLDDSYVRIKLDVFSLKNISKTSQLLVETLLPEFKLVVEDKEEFEKREESICQEQYLEF